MPPKPKPDHAVVTGEEEESESPRPSPEQGTDSEALRSAPSEPSAGVQREAPSDVEVERLKKRVADTEEWVARLRAAQREGHRLTSAREAESSSDVRALKKLLEAGDDDGFIEGVLRAAERRSVRRVREESEEVEAAQRIASRVNEIVRKHAPDVPPRLFWSFAQQVESEAPGDFAKQVELAIQYARDVLEPHAKELASRHSANRQNRESAETIEGGGARGTTTKGTVPESLTDQLHRIQGRSGAK